MPVYLEHEITRASFAAIDQELGEHALPAAEYAVVRRVIHTTADFEFAELLSFQHQPFDAAKTALKQGLPIVTDVSMVAAGIRTVAAKTWQSPVTVAVQQALAQTADAAAGPPRQTRSALGMCQCAEASPGAIFAVGNAPTALLTLCEGIERGAWKPALVIGAPVGFINVLESKQALSALAVPHVLVAGRKGGSAVAAAIMNALMIWAWEQTFDE